MNTAQKIQSNVATGFDIENLDNDSINEIKHTVAIAEDAEGNPTMGFIIVGKNSLQYMNATDEMRITNIKKASKRNKAIDTATDDGAALVAKTISDNDRKVALAVVTGWFGFNSEGAPATFDKRVVEKAFIKYPTWQAKVTAALENEANFTPV